jgi:L-threonylcarbamoyladenylate synthase
MKHFWPGPLTLLFPSDSSVIPGIVTANRPTIAVRMPSHPVARALIAITNTPIAAPSANLSGKPSPTQAKHVLRDLDGRVGIILDGGPCEVGLESTVIDGLDGDGDLRVLRPGGVTVEEIKHALQTDIQDINRVPRVLVFRRDYTDTALEQTPTTPGMKYRHYSPAVPVFLLFTSTPPTGIVPSLAIPLLTSLRDRNPTQNAITKIGILTPNDSPFATCDLPGETIEWCRYRLGPTSAPSVIARRFFDGLLTLENEGVDMIAIVAIPDDQEGLAVMNRANKAATASFWVDDSDVR